PHGGGNVGRIDTPEFVHFEGGDLEALVCREPLARVQYRVVLDAGGNDVLPAALLRLRHGAALDRQVVAFAAAAGENDFICPAVENLSASIAGVVECSPRTTTPGVDARRVAPLLEPV